MSILTAFTSSLSSPSETIHWCIYHIIQIGTLYASFNWRMAEDDRKGQPLYLMPDAPLPAPAALYSSHTSPLGHINYGGL